MNVQAGCKAKVVLPRNSITCGMENDGIVCVVNRLKPPGVMPGISEYHSPEEGPLWEVTSISRMFTQYRLAQMGDYVAIKPIGMTWSAIIADRYLRRIVEDDTDLFVEHNEELTA